MPFQSKHKGENIGKFQTALNDCSVLSAVWPRSEALLINEVKTHISKTKLFWPPLLYLSEGFQLADVYIPPSHNVIFNRLIAKKTSAVDDQKKKNLFNFPN